MADDRGCEEILRDGTRILVRPIRAGDLELERRFIEDLSPVARRFRFLTTMRSPSAALLRQLTTIDPATEAAFVAIVGNGTDEHEIGVGRFSARQDPDDCEFAIAVSDEWQNRGLGTLLMRHLIGVARARGIETMHAISAADNQQMRRLAAHLHFRSARDPNDPGQAFYSVDLRATAPPPAAG